MRRATASAAAPAAAASLRATRTVEELEPRRLLAVSLLGSFNPGLGQLNSIAFDPPSGNVYLHVSHTAVFHEFTPAGVEAGSPIAAPGNSSNDGDLDVATQPITLNGTAVPAGTLLCFNGDDSPTKVYAVETAAGGVLAQADLPAGVAGSVGGAQHPSRGTLVNISFTSDIISEIEPNQVSVLNQFPVAPTGSPAFDVYFGDVDVLASTGDVFVVSSSQPLIREFTPTGGYRGDIDLSGLELDGGLSGISFDDARGEAWVSTTNGIVYRLGGFEAGGPLAGLQSFDLTDDFSATANSNGVWGYREGNNLLPHVDWWQRQLGFSSSAQPGWARSEDGTDRLPFVFKSVGTETFAHDWQAGDVVVHTTDTSNGVGSGLANLTWTSPADGIAHVSGGVWMGRDIGRGNDWALLKNGVAFTQGNVFSGDSFSRASPFNFTAGSGGVGAVQNIPVRNGDTIALQLTATNGASGDFVGTKFHVDLVPGASAPGTVESVNTVNIPGPTPQANDLVTLDNGKILAVGTANQNSGDIALFRLNADGTLDTTFGTGGGVTFLDLTGSDADEDARALALQPDGKIIVVGTINEGNGGSNYFVARFNADGTLDTTFGGNGFNIADFATETGAPPGTISADQGTAVAVRPDGRIVVAGVTDALDPNGDFAMVAYNADGSDDITFGGNGTTKNGSNKLVTPFGQGERAEAVTVQADGKIVIGGQVATSATAGMFGVLRLNADGSLDPTFGGGGLVTTDLRDGGDRVTSLIVQGDGKIVAGGVATSGAEGTDAFDSDFALVRYNADGSLDDAFGTNGVVVTDVPGQIAAISQLAVDAGGNLIAAGRAAAGRTALDVNQFGAAVARYKPDGALDTAFGTNGILVIPFTNLTSSSLRAGPASVGAAVIQNPGADAVRQQALIALSAQGKLRVLLTAGGEVRLATVSGDAGAPTATIALLPSVTDLGLPAQTFVVEYADDLAIDVSTLGTGDILVSGPGVTDQPAELVSVDNSANGTPRRATYRFVPAGGAGFTAAHNGTYQLSIAADQVKDTSGFSLAAGPVTDATFTVNVNGDAANLVAGALTGNFPASVVGGGKAKGAAVQVTNNGTQPAVGTIAIRLVASTDGTVDDADTEIVTVNQKVKLKAGQAKALKLKFKTFPANLPDGDYFLLARIDSANAIPETADNFDNVAATATPINIAAPFVDLGFAGPIGGFKSPLAPGKKGMLAVPLRNNGNIPAKATVSANLFASLDQAMSGDDRSLGTIPVKASLKQGTTKNTKLKFTLPADLAPGQYFLILVLNPAGNDRDTGDNTAFSATPITVG